MIGLKDYVNDRYDNHEQAMKALGMSQPTFYRRLRDPSWKVVMLCDGKSQEKHLIVNVHCEINVRVNDGALHTSNG